MQYNITLNALTKTEHKEKHLPRQVTHTHSGFLAGSDEAGEFLVQWYFCDYGSLTHSLFQMTFLHLLQRQSTPTVLISCHGTTTHHCTSHYYLNIISSSLNRPFLFTIQNGSSVDCVTPKYAAINVKVCINIFRHSGGSKTQD